MSARKIFAQRYKAAHENRGEEEEEEEEEKEGEGARVTERAITLVKASRVSNRHPYTSPD